MAGFFDRLFRRRASRENVYHGLREQLFSGPLPGTIAVLDWHVGSGVATIVAVSDGTVSLYLSSGGGTIGAGAHEGPRRAGERMVTAATAARPLLSIAGTHPLPSPNGSAFHLRTEDGVRSALVDSEALRDPKHPLAPFFGAGQAVLTAIRTLPPR